MTSATRRPAARATRHGQAGPGEAPITNTPDGQLEVVQRALAEFGLTGYHTRVLIALLARGPSTASHLAWAAEVPRTGVYPVLRTLNAMGLAEPAGGTSKLWSAPPRPLLLERLRIAGEEQLREQAARKELARRRIDDILPEAAPEEDPSPIRLMRFGAESGGLYARCLAAATREVLVFNKGPYFGVGDPNPAVLEMLERGVSTRALYEQADFDGPQGDGLRRETDAYVAAGVEARIVEQLPLKLALFDGEVALLPLEDPEHPLAQDAPHLHVDHAGFATFARASFEHYWMQGRPYPRSVRPQPDIRQDQQPTWKGDVS